MVLQASNPTNSGGRGRRTESSRHTQEKIARPYVKKNKNKRTGDMVQMVEHLTCGPGFNHSTAKRKNECGFV
jgi:hypothetical protein